MTESDRPGPVAETRQRLIEGACRAYEDQGIEGVRLGHLLEAAGVSRRTFYLYFSGKDALLVAVYDEVVGDLIHRVRQRVLDAEDATERLFAGLDAYLDFQERGGRLITLLQAEAANPASSLNPAREQTLDALVGLMDEQVRATLDVALDPLVYRALFVAVEGLVIHVRSGGAFTAEGRAAVSAVMRPLFLQTVTGHALLPRVAD